MFVFGDSLADVGTTNFIPNCTARADFTPYGVSSFLSPTGRFTNGLTVFDFISTYLELLLLRPYHELPYHEHGIYSHGANFASGGSGLLDSTAADKNIVKLSDQICRFEELSRHVRKKSYLRNSLYCISSGGNDINAHFNDTSSNPNTTEFFNAVVGAHGQHIERLHGAGARKFLILDISAIGCTPIARFKYSFAFKGGCAEPGNDLAREYNIALKKLVDHLNEKLQQVIIILLNSFDYLRTMIDNGEAFGFSETKSACCGAGKFRANVSCGLTSPPDLYCSDVDNYLFWDAVHPTQRVYSIFSEEIWRGNSSVMHPLNLSTLILGRKA